MRKAEYNYLQFLLEKLDILAERVAINRIRRMDGNQGVPNKKYFYKAEVLGSSDTSFDVRVYTLVGKGINSIKKVPRTVTVDISKYLV